MAEVTEGTEVVEGLEAVNALEAVEVLGVLGFLENYSFLKKISTTILPRRLLHVLPCPNPRPCPYPLLHINKKNVILFCHPR